jgi:hypothetical protein
MKKNLSAVDELLLALGVDLPVDFLAKLDIGQFLDQLDKAVALVPGERQRLGDLLRAAQRINFSQIEGVLAEHRRGGRQLSEILSGQGLISQHEADVLAEFRRRQADKTAASGQFALGNILVSSGQITRPQLERALLRQIDTGRRIGEELIEAGDATKAQVERGLLLQKKLIAYALAIAVGVAPLAALVPEAAAGQAGAALAVSATVVASARAQTSHRVTQLQLSAADIARGHVEVPAAVRFSVATSSRSGYVVAFHALGNVFSSVEILGLGDAVQLGADGGAVVVRGPPTAGLTYELGFRFVISQDTVPGIYPMPLQLSVRAL